MRDVTIVDFQDSTMLDALQIAQMGEQLYELVDTRNCRKLILDFSKVKFLASAAIGVLMNLHKKSQAIKGQFVLCGLREDLMRVFKIMKLDRVLTFFPNEDAALAHFGIMTAG